MTTDHPDGYDDETVALILAAAASPKSKPMSWDEFFEYLDEAISSATHARLRRVAADMDLEVAETGELPGDLIPEGLTDAELTALLDK